MTKTLTLPSNTFGVEIEINAGYECMSRIARGLRSVFAQAGIADVVSINNLGPHNRYIEGYASWNVKEDGSCGLEITSPPMDWNSISTLKLVLDYLVSNHYEVDENCGLHVHHMLAGLDAKQLRRIWIAWALYGGMFEQFVDYSRVGNRFCKRLTYTGWHEDYYYQAEALDHTQTVDALISQVTPIRSFEHLVENYGRYTQLNATNWWASGRVEVRLHEGTLNYHKIVNWIRMTQLFLHASKEWSLKRYKKISKYKQINKINTFVKLYKMFPDSDMSKVVSSILTSKRKVAV